MTRTKKLSPLTRVIACVAVWSIAVVMALRLRHPFVTLTVAVLAIALTVTILTSKPSQGDQ